MKQMNIAYAVKEGLYLNLTNRCPCACTFCIRNEGDGVYGSNPLWLEHEPSFDEVKAALEAADAATASSWRRRNLLSCHPWKFLISPREVPVINAK